ARNAALAERLERIAATVNGGEGLSATLVPAMKTGRVPVLEITIDRTRLHIDAIEFSRRLQAGDPPIHLAERRVGEDVLMVDPSTLRAEDDLLLASRIVDVAGGRGASGRGAAEAPRSITAASRKART